MKKELIDKIKNTLSLNEQDENNENERLDTFIKELEEILEHHFARKESNSIIDFSTKNIVKFSRNIHTISATEKEYRCLIGITNIDQTSEMYKILSYIYHLKNKEKLLSIYNERLEKEGFNKAKLEVLEVENNIFPRYRQFPIDLYSSLGSFNESKYGIGISFIEKID